MGFKLGHSCKTCEKQLSDSRAVYCRKHFYESRKGKRNSLNTEFKKGKQPWNSGKEWSEESKAKMSQSHKGKTLSEEHREKIELAQRRRVQEGTHNMYISDRTKLAKKQERNDSSYKEWRMSVYKRDNFICRMKNQDCSGRIIAHHILGWASYPELRYEVNNGITLCQDHHPLRRSEEKRLESLFRKLVSVSNVPHWQE